jgi:small-conductance mechanosensitive channel
MGTKHFEPEPEAGRRGTERFEQLAAELEDLREELAAHREVRRADVARLEDRVDDLSRRVDDLEAALRTELDDVRAAVEANRRWRQSIETTFSGDDQGSQNDGQV